MSSPSDAGFPRASTDEDAVDGEALDWIRRRVRRHQSWRADRAERGWRSVAAWVLSLLLHLLLVLGILLAPVDMPAPPPPDHDKVLQVDLSPPPPLPAGGKVAGSRGSGSRTVSSTHAGPNGAHHVVHRSRLVADHMAVRPAAVIVSRSLPPSMSARMRSPKPALPPAHPSIAPLPVVVTDHQPHPPAARPPTIVIAPISLQPLAAAEQIRPPRPPRAEGNQPMPAPMPVQQLPSVAPTVVAPEQARISLPQARLASAPISAPRLMAATSPSPPALTDIKASDTVTVPTMPVGMVTTVPASSPLNSPALTVAAASLPAESATELPVVPETAAPLQPAPAEGLAQAVDSEPAGMDAPVTPPSMPPVAVVPADLPALPSDTVPASSMAAPDRTPIRVDPSSPPSAPVAAMPEPMSPAAAAEASPEGDQAAADPLAKKASAKEGAAADAADLASHDVTADTLAGPGDEAVTAGQSSGAGQGQAQADGTAPGTGAASQAHALEGRGGGAADGQANSQAGGQTGGQIGGQIGGQVGAHGHAGTGAAAGGSSNNSPPGHYISLRAPANTDVGPSRSVTIEYHRTRFDKDWVADDENQLDSAMRHIGEKLRSHHKLHLPGGVSFHCDTGAQPDSGSRGLGSLLPFGCHGEAPPQASGKDGDRRLDLAPAHALDGSATAASVAGKPLPRPVVAPLDTTAMCETARMAGGPLPAGCKNREIRRPAPASSTSWAPPLDRF